MSLLLSQIETSIEQGNVVQFYSEGVMYEGIVMSSDLEYIKIVTTEKHNKILTSSEWIIRISSITGFSPQFNTWDAARIFRINPELKYCEDLTGDISDPFGSEDDDDDEDDDDRFEIFFA